MITISSAAVTHPGHVREANEDSMVVTPRLVAVADGLGGHAAGEVASRIAVERMGQLAERERLHPDDVIDAIADANRLIVEEAHRRQDRLGMGTTLCGVGIVQVGGSDHCVVFNVGDSRVYRFVDGRLSQVSVDHSEVEELRAAGRITADQAARHPRRNVITRCLGSAPSPTPDIWVYPPTAHERYVVCSDGLTGEVDDDAIAATLARHEDPGPAASALLEQALAAGGRDNIAVIVVDLDNGADASLLGAVDSDTAPRLRAPKP
ncbi:MAG TPA: protein phosphatase 2C domain-containing protein [Jatrophihabitans sp.]|jgi:protein phosphatase|uniref:PP2C family protein-serine/threonine phosphatase n=1 Tax=Jatrophihabitans sp. TaxID=1932789 RepID=UPI002E021C29|nr:protein phosphatase 2C domain-containing protein [Jatrophihabitans sp.]